MRKNKKETIGIIGLGKFGMYLAEKLSESNKSIICIDKEENKVKKATNLSEYAFVSEDLSKNALEEMGFKECNTIVVCIGEHLDTAIFATLNALALEVNKVICIANSDEQGIVLEKLGAEVIYPYKDSSEKLAKKILSNSVLDFISLSEEVEILETKVPKRYIGKTIIESNIRKDFGLNIIAIETDNKIQTRINPNYIFKQEDCIVVIGEKKMLQDFE